MVILGFQILIKLCSKLRKEDIRFRMQKQLKFRQWGYFKGRYCFSPSADTVAEVPKMLDNIPGTKQYTSWTLTNQIKHY